MKKGLIALVACMVLLAASSAYASDADAILGEWYTDKDESIVEIYKCGESYCGRITWLKEPKTPEGEVKADRNNPDESLKDRGIIGMDILSDLKHKRKNKWSGGKIYDPNTGKTYSSKAKLKKGKLSIRGFIGIALVGRTTVWRKKD